MAKAKTVNAGKGGTSSDAPPYPVFNPAIPLQNERHELFCQELLLLKPQLRAYMKAYPDSTWASSAANSSRLIEDDKVKARLAYLKQELRDRYKMTPEDVHARMVMAASFDPADLYDANGNAIPIHDLPPDIRLSIESIESDEITVGCGEDQKVIGHTKKIKTISKGKALEMIARTLGMFQDNLKVSGSLTLEQLVTGQGTEASE